jgi:putative flippase GtrA
LIRALAMRLVRSGGAGILATVADVGTLTLLVSVFGMTPVIAGIPSLIFGSIVMFLGQKYFVFAQRSVTTLGREAVLYTIVQAIGILVTAWVFKLLLGLSPLFAGHYVLVRLVANNLVWLGYFFPLWHFVFKSPAAKPAAILEAGGVDLRRALDAPSLDVPGLDVRAGPDRSAGGGPPFVG